MLPVAGAIAVAGSAVLAGKEPEKFNLENPGLEKELENAKQQAELLITKSESLRSEAEKLLQDSWQINLLTAVQYACDRTLELPQKIEQLSQRLHGGDSLLSVQELKEQLYEVQRKKNASSGIAKQQLERLENSLQNNINLAQEGQHARQAQVFSLVNIITESAETFSTAVIPKQNISKGEAKTAQKFIDYLLENEQQIIFAQYGFRPIKNNLDLQTIPNSPWSKNIPGVEINGNIPTTPSPKPEIINEIQKLWIRAN